MHKVWDSLWYNGIIATCEDGYGLIENAAIAVKDGKICFVDNVVNLPGKPESLAAIVNDLQGKCVTPGLIDCHTHVVYAGNRAHEFAARMQGKSYKEIAQAGGGIFSTVNATRNASEVTLFNESFPRAWALRQSGVTTLEIKSGYGLDWPTELKMLQVADQLGAALDIEVYKTFLGAHTVAPAYKENSDLYVDIICEEMIPQIAAGHYAQAVDVFCESIAFSYAQTERIFKTAKSHGLALKCHADQLTDSNAAKLAAEYRALSADHLEYTSLEGIKAMANHQTVAVLLPGAFYYLQETKKPPLEMLRAHGVPLAIASDCNPGTSPIASMQLILNLACTQFGFTPEEALCGATKHAASALGMLSTHGTLTVGKQADLAVWNISHPDEIVYFLGKSPLKSLIKNGNLII